MKSAGLLEQDPGRHLLPPLGHLTLDFAPTTWLADIYALARLRLARIGVDQVYGGGLCTYTDRDRFILPSRTANRPHGQPDLARDGGP
jgi:copper oxidase (laccase) domain-containing protein